MGRSVGAALSGVASVVLVTVLVAAFFAESPGDVMLYYGFYTVNPLFAGVFAIGVIVAFAASRADRVSEPVGAGIALGLALACLLVATTWALTGRVDVFLAPGWAFPVQRWVLVVVSVLVVLGAALHAWTIGLFPSRG